MQADFQYSQDPISSAFLLLNFSEAHQVSQCAPKLLRRALSTFHIKMELVVSQPEKASEMVRCLERH